MSDAELAEAVVRLVAEAKGGIPTLPAELRAELEPALAEMMFCGWRRDYYFLHKEKARVVRRLPALLRSGVNGDEIEEFHTTLCQSGLPALSELQLLQMAYDGSLEITAEVLLDVLYTEDCGPYWKPFYEREYPDASVEDTARMQELARELKDDPSVRLWLFTGGA